MTELKVVIVDSGSGVLVRFGVGDMVVTTFKVVVAAAFTVWVVVIDFMTAVRVVDSTFVGVWLCLELLFGELVVLFWLWMGLLVALVRMGLLVALVWMKLLVGVVWMELLVGGVVWMELLVGGVVWLELLAAKLNINIKLV